MIMGALSLVYASEEVTVQVISAVYEKSVTDEFDIKLKKTNLEIHKNIEGGRYVVTLGTYRDEKSAEGALKKARILVNKEAFIRPINRNHTVDKTVVSGHGTSSQWALANHGSSSAEQPQTVVVVVAPIAVEKPVEPKPVSTPPVDAKAYKRENYKNELSDAINFYKTSPYYRFEPVVLRQ